MHSIFRRAAISLMFVSLSMSAKRLDASPAFGDQERNTVEIVENVPQADRSILEKAVIPQLARQTKGTWLPRFPKKRGRRALPEASLASSSRFIRMGPYPR